MSSEGGPRGGAVDANEMNRKGFSLQAGAFEDSRYSFGRPEVLDWMAENTPVRPGEIVLEVTAGTGWFARAIATTAGVVIATDITPEMLAAGQRSSLAAKIHNIVFQEADVFDLPFLSDSFDGVASRLGMHHLTEPARAVAEMVRVCRPGGWLVLIDLVGPDGPQGEVFNRLERLRDPAHLRALGRSELVELLEGQGARVQSSTHRQNILDLQLWLDQTQTPERERAEIVKEVEDELAGGRPTGLNPIRGQDGEVRFSHRWELVVGRI